MSGVSSLRERAEALREGIEELLLEESARQRTAELKEAEALVSKFCELGATDEGIATLDALRTALGRAKAAPAAPGKDASDDGALLDEAITWVAELRARSLDELASIVPGREPGAVDGTSRGASRPNVASESRDGKPFGFRASRGAPTVHEPANVPMLELLARQRRWDEPIADDPDESPVSVSSADPVVASLARLGRDTMEDIAILGGLRRLGDDDRWFDARGFEDRLLANLDLLWALDAPAHDDVPRLGVARALFRYALEWALPDWGRAFALAFGLACTSSESALRWVLLAMRRSGTASLGGYVHGLSLASGPDVDRTILSELRNEAPPELLAALLEIAERRRMFEASAVAPFLAHPAPAVKIAALRAMRHAPDDLAIASAERLLATTEGSVAVHAADELARRGIALGLDYLRNTALRVESLADRTIALRALAVAGLPRDEALVIDTARARDDGTLWMSFYGTPSVVPFIFEVLNATHTLRGFPAERIRRAERAFHRVTGLDPSRPPKALYEEYKDGAMAKRAPRLRGGEAYSPELVLKELASPASRQAERRILARELALVAPRAPYVDLDGFVATQLAVLASAAGELGSRRSARAR